MVIQIFLALTLLSVSCTRSIETDYQGEDESFKMRNKIEFDSVIINYWESAKAFNYEIRFKEDSLLIKNKSLNKSKIYINENTARQFLNYINIFFIEKSESIELSKKKRPEILITDFSSIEVTIFDKNTKELKRSVQLQGNERYEIEYNSRFLAFIDFINKLTLEI